MEGLKCGSCDASDGDKISETRIDDRDNRMDEDLPTNTETTHEGNEHIRMEDNEPEEQIVKEELTYHDLPAELKTKLLGYFHPLHSLLVCKEWQYIIKNNSQRMRTVRVYLLELSRSISCKHRSRILRVKVTYKEVDPQKPRVSNFREKLIRTTKLESIFDVIRFIEPQILEISNIPFFLIKQLFNILPNKWRERIANIKINQSNDDNADTVRILTKLPNLKALGLFDLNNEDAKLVKFIDNMADVEYLGYANCHPNAKVTNDDLMIIGQKSLQSSTGIKNMLLVSTCVTVDGILQFLKNAKFQSTFHLCFHGVTGGFEVTQGICIDHGAVTTNCSEGCIIIQYRRDRNITVTSY